MRQITTSVRVPALLLVCSALATACGGGSDGSGAGGGIATAQTITFADPGPQSTIATPVTLSATASSGMPVAFRSTTTSICSINGNTLTLTAEGNCSIIASQSGGSGYAPATSVAYTFPVTGPSTVVFMTGFGATATVEGGSYTVASGSDLDGWWCASNWCGSEGSFAPDVAAEASSFSYHYNTPSVPTVGEYVTINVFAPGLTTGLSNSGNTSGVQVTNQAALRFNLAQNTEWFSSATPANPGNADVKITLILGNLFTGPCHIELQKTMSPTAAANTAYAVPLSSFAITTGCGQTTTDPLVALAGNPVSQIRIESAGGNKSVQNTTTMTYPTQITLTGGINFK